MWGGSPNFMPGVAIVWNQTLLYLSAGLPIEVTLVTNIVEDLSHLSYDGGGDVANIVGVGDAGNDIGGDGENWKQEA